MRILRQLFPRLDFRSMRRRHFTVEEANRTLPLVRRIVEDIVRSYTRWEERKREFEVVGGNRRAGEEDPHAERLEAELQSLARDIAGFVAELEELGVEFKDYDLGLVDFPGEIGGEPVYLCWRLGESSVQYWHPVEGGYSARQPLAAQPAR